MYTIKQAGLRSGVTVPLLRAWERRYGVVSPVRTAAGYRLYDDDAVGRLRAMRRLVDEGWTASEAARAVLAGEVATVEAPPASSRIGPPRDGSAGGVDLERRSQEPYSGLIASFVDAAARMDAAGIETALDEAFAVGSFERVAEEILLPSLRALGDAWQAGRVDVAGEHAASHAVTRRLAAAFAAAARASAEGGLVIGLPPGSRHELGALAFATAARRLGLAVLYLGADVPESSWVEAARRTRARATVVAVPTVADASAAATVLEALGAVGPGCIRAVGGAGAAALRPVPGVVPLPSSVSAAAATLRAMIDEAATASG